MSGGHRRHSPKLLVRGCSADRFMLLLLLQPSHVMHSVALCFPWSASHSAPEHCSFCYLHLSRLLLIACLSSEISQLLMLLLLLSASTWRWPPCTDQHCLTPPPNHRISLTVDAIGLKERRRELCKQSRAIVVHRLAQCAGSGVAVFTLYQLRRSIAAAAAAAPDQGF